MNAHPELVSVDVAAIAERLGCAKIGALLADAVRSHDKQRPRLLRRVLAHELHDLADGPLLHNTWQQVWLKWLCDRI